MSKTHTIALSKRKMLLAAGLALTVGFTGLTVSGAYFTDQVTVEGNSAAAATVKLGSTGSTATSANTQILATNLIPLTAAEADTKGFAATINVRNVGTAPIDWAIKLSYPTGGATTDQAAFADQVNIKTTIGTGTATGPVTLATLATQTTPTLTGTGLAAGSTTAVAFRIYLPEATSTTFQGRSVPFNVQVRAIQAGAPVAERDAAANYVTP
jgi:hypothetical protein